jgi:hypothetical protein
MPTDRETLLRLGAAARIRELEAEIDRLEKFAGERSIGRRATSAGGARRRPRWTSAQRKAAADRMRKYWASRKAKTKK